MKQKQFHLSQGSVLCLPPVLLSVCRPGLLLSADRLPLPALAFLHLHNTGSYVVLASVARILASLSMVCALHTCHITVFRGSLVTNELRSHLAPGLAFSQARALALSCEPDLVWLSSVTSVIALCIFLLPPGFVCSELLFIHSFCLLMKADYRMFLRSQFFFSYFSSSDA